MATALRAVGDHDAAQAALGQAMDAVDALRRGGRAGEGRLAEAFVLAADNKPDQSIAAMHRLLDEAELPFTGWTIPIEPLLIPFRSTAPFRELLRRLAERAA